MLVKNFSVINYVNGDITFVSHNLSKKEAYQMAVPREAMIPNPASRWHVMLYNYASAKIDDLLVGETLRVCWQDTHPELDTEHILIQRELNL